jgi:hypothetical protein
MHLPMSDDTLLTGPEEPPNEDASFAAGARRSPSPFIGKDDARGSAPGTLGSQSEIRNHPNARRRSDKRYRDYRLHLRLNAEEYTHAFEQAGIAGMKPTTLARNLLMGLSIKPANRLPADVYRAVTSFGNNLNQLAKAMNTSPFDCRDRLDDLRGDAKAIIACLSRS